MLHPGVFVALAEGFLASRHALVVVRATQAGTLNMTEFCAAFLEDTIEFVEFTIRDFRPRPPPSLGILTRSMKCVCVCVCVCVRAIGKDIHVVYTQREGGREGENRTCRYTHQHAHPSQLHNSEDVYNTPLIKTSPNEQVCIMYTSVCVPQSVNIHIFQPCRAGRGKCPEPTSDSAKNISVCTANVLFMCGSC